MKNLLPFSILLWISIAVAEMPTYQELLEGMDADARTRLRGGQGLVREVDRAIVLALLICEGVVRQSHM